MDKNIAEFIIDGYGSGETNLLDRLDADPPAQKQAFLDFIITPIIAAMGDPTQAAVVTISGHSDRVDTAGLDQEQRRAQELTASSDRTFAAFEGVKDLVTQGMADPPPNDWDAVLNVAFLLHAAGAALLVHTGAVLSEDQRRANRRVQFRVVSFLP